MAVKIVMAPYWWRPILKSPAVVAALEAQAQAMASSGATVLPPEEGAERARVAVLKSRRFT